MRKPIILTALLLLAALPALALTPTSSPPEYTVDWQTPGTDYRDSMPIGNGDIGVNIWTEQNGDVVFLISKTDAWTENAQLVKLGRVRVHLDPNPFNADSSFHQTLRAQAGEIDILGDNNTVMRVWVDANAPVIHLEATGNKPMTLRATAELWRNKPRKAGPAGELWQAIRELAGIPGDTVTIDPDTVLPADRNRLIWLHHNTRSTYPLVLNNQHLGSLLSKYPDPLLGRTFGVLMKGPGLVSFADLALRSSSPQTAIRLDLYALTKEATSIDKFKGAIEKTARSVDKIDIEAARKAHQQWWSDFWNRSWIRVSGSSDAEKVSQSYAMTRWIDACGGRGAMPIKFNGSIFTVGQETPPDRYVARIGDCTSPDFRLWGGNYWTQNQRHIYWPMIAAGDYDLLAPYFAMYRSNLPLEIDRTRLYYGHDGASYPETQYFWGTPNNFDFGWNNPSNILGNTYVRYYIVGGLEVTAMMFTQYEYTQDQAFAKDTLIPVADAIVTYYDQHWPRGDWPRKNGKIHMDPAQSIETYQQAVNPTPDIAGLMSVLPRLLALPNDLTTADQRKHWAKILADLPPLPTGTTGSDGKLADWGRSDPKGKPIILPAQEYTPQLRNLENPGLYPLFPFRLYGVGLPDIDLALNTFAARRFDSKNSGYCWNQDSEDAALLGLTEIAKAQVIAHFTQYGSDPIDNFPGYIGKYSSFGPQRFKWFYPKDDWIPDQDNGGNAMATLQFMLMQCNPGDKAIHLLPAWPADWNCDFKLCAPYNTTVEGSVKDGKVTNLIVTPSSRAKDVVPVIN